MMHIVSTREREDRVSAGLWSLLISVCLVAAMSLPILIRTTPSAVVTAVPTMAGQQEKIPVSHQTTLYGGAPETILDLQSFRQATSIQIRSAAGQEGTATLVNLNPTIGIWYVLKVVWNQNPEITYHLENPAHLAQKVFLDPKFPSGIVIEEKGERHLCEVFRDSPTNELEQAKASQRIFAPVCDDRIYLRNPAKGRRTTLEAATEFLRNQVWGGEKVIALFHHLMKDTHRETGQIHIGGSGLEKAMNDDGSTNVPLAASIDPRHSQELIASSEFGIATEITVDGGLRPGAWYAAAGNPGVYVSLLRPGIVDPSILQSYKTRVSSLDSVEASSLCYLVAIDLDRFDLSYALGTEHPAVGWSERILPQMRDSRLPGPDGIGSTSPLISTGLINPQDARNTVATFTGGFKREHGAFRYGDLAQKNHGSHYGFIEDGVVFSKLQPGLATIFILSDGQTEMKTWEEKDNELLARVKYARQNGVPIVESDSSSGAVVPGALVNRWGPGNWSGSEDMKLRTIRAGIAMQTRGNKRFLIYAVFSDATPSAMARVFQAYQCQYAFLLDMNALEHTYFALYRRSGEQLLIDHLIRGMSQVDKSSAGEILPRFLAYPDNRDFFYLTRRKPQ